MHAKNLTVLGLCAVFLLAGCAATPPPSVNRTVGNCWTTNDTVNLRHIDGGAESPIDCSSSLATSYTYFVGTVKGAPAKSYLSEGILAATTMNDLPDSVNHQTSGECEESLTKLFTGMNVLALRGLRIVTDTAFPSATQWNDGERWFSCEVSLRQLGSALTKPTWEALPFPITKLVADVAESPQKYRLCVETVSNGVPPTSDQGVVTTCAAARWALRPADLGVKYGEIFPGSVTVKSLATAKCAASNVGALSIITPLVSKFDWEASQPSVACWVSTTANPVATPTPAPTPSPSPSLRRVIPVVPAPVESVPVESDPVVVPEFSPPPTAPASLPTPETTP